MYVQLDGYKCVCVVVFYLLFFFCLFFFLLGRGAQSVTCTDRPAMTIAVDLGRKATKQTKQI